MPPRKRGKKFGKLCEENASPKCYFCGDSADDEETFGKKMSKGGITVHYFCMLFSSALAQSGKTDEDGLLGFLAKDILREINRGKRLKCSFCKKNGATIGCSNSSCRQKYHYCCGAQNETLFQFFGSYSSFCEEHRPRQPPPTRGRLGFKGVAKTCCSICMSAVTARASNNTLRSPCCKNSWFHRKCIQAMANSSGLHFFKCPLCNNKEHFQEEMLTYGIYIPDQDAAWELEPNAFEDLLARPSFCDIEECQCLQGKQHNVLGSEWELMTCDMCGSKATHLKCSDLKTALDDWACQECTLISGKYKPKEKKIEKVNPENYLEEKYRKACKGPGRTKKKQSNKRKWSVGDETLSDCATSPQLEMKKKRRKMVATGPKQQPNTENNNLSSTSIPSPSKMDVDIDSEFNESDVNLTLNRLRVKLINSSSKKLKKKLSSKLKAKLCHNTSVGNLVVGEKRSANNRNIKKGLHRSKSVSHLHSEEKKILKKYRATKRSQQAKQAAAAIQKCDVKNAPRWLQIMYEDDLITGKNLGDKFVQDSPTQSIVKEVGQDNSTMQRYSRTSMSAIEDPIDTSTLNELNISNKDLKQLTMTDFLSGKNLGKQFVRQSPAKFTVHKKYKLKLNKAKKMLKMTESNDAQEVVTTLSKLSGSESKPVTKTHQRKLSANGSLETSPKNNLLINWLKSPLKSEEEDKNDFCYDVGKAIVQPSFSNSVSELSDDTLMRSPLASLSGNQQPPSPIKASKKKKFKRVFGEENKVKSSPKQQKPEKKCTENGMTTDLTSSLCNSSVAELKQSTDFNGNVSPKKKKKDSEIKIVKTIINRSTSHSTVLVSYSCEDGSDSNCNPQQLNKISSDWGRPTDNSTPKEMPVHKKKLFRSRPEKLFRSRPAKLFRSRPALDEDHNDDYCVYTPNGKRSDTQSKKDTSCILITDSDYESGSKVQSFCSENKAPILPLDPGYESESDPYFIENNSVIKVNEMKFQKFEDFVSDNFNRSCENIKSDTNIASSDICKEDLYGLSSQSESELVSSDDEVIVLDDTDKDYQRSPLRCSKNSNQNNNNNAMSNNASCVNLCASSSSIDTFCVGFSDDTPVRDLNCGSGGFQVFNVNPSNSFTSQTPPAYKTLLAPMAIKGKNRDSRNDTANTATTMSMQAAPVKTPGPCAFVMFGEFKDSKMCVIS